MYFLGSGNHAGIEPSVTVTIPFGNDTQQQGKIQK